MESIVETVVISCWAFMIFIVYILIICTSHRRNRTAYPIKRMDRPEETTLLNKHR